MKSDHVQQVPLFYRIVTPIMLAIGAALSYYSSLRYELQFDDIANINKHFNIRHYTFKNLFFSGSRWISYWLNSLYYRLGKFDPFYYRLGNVTIHTINGILVFFILIAIFSPIRQPSFFKRNALSISLLTALLFVLHPVQTQTVSYVIQGQLEGLATLCILSAVLCFLYLQRTPKLWAKILLAVLFFIIIFLATGTKEIAIITPLLVLLVDWFFVARASWQDLKNRWWLHGGAFLLIGAIYVWFLSAKFFAQLFSLSMRVENNLGNVITDRYDDMIRPLPFFISQFKVILHYIWIYIWPFNISVEYDWILSKNFFAIDCFFPFILLTIISFFIYKLLKKNPTNLIGFAALWFAVTMAPRSTIMPSPELMVDYKTYPASFSLMLLFSITLIALFEWIKVKLPRITFYTERYKIAHSFTILIAVGLGLSTASRNLVWSSGLEFWGNIVKNAPGKIRAYNNYGVELAQKAGKYAEAIPYYQHAIRMDKKYRDPYNNLAVSYAALKQYDQAIATLWQSLQINPNYPEAYNNMASFMIEKKDYAQAEIALKRAIHIRPYYGKAYYNLGRLYMETNRPEEALETFKAACTQADFDNEIGFTTYAQCSLYLKKYDDAMIACKKVLEFNPHNVDAQFNLANLYYVTKHYHEAIAAYEQLIAQYPQDIRFRYNLAEAYFGAGNIPTALTQFSRLKNLPGITPNVYLRIASCYEKLGNPQQAKQSLEELLQKKLPDESRQQLELALHNLATRYQLS